LGPTRARGAGAMESGLSVSGESCWGALVCMPSSEGGDDDPMEPEPYLHHRHQATWNSKGCTHEKQGQGKGRGARRNARVKGGKGVG
jgi:hypothetical protein